MEVLKLETRRPMQPTDQIEVKKKESIELVQLLPLGIEGSINASEEEN